MNGAFTNQNIYGNEVWTRPSVRRAHKRIKNSPSLGKKKRSPFNVIDIFPFARQNKGER